METSSDILDLNTRGIERVAIVGVGAVGSTAAYAMVQAGVAKEIILVDLDRRRAEGEWMDLQHCVPFAQPVFLRVAAPDEVENCDFIIVTAGVAQRPGESRLNLVQRNTQVFSSLFPMISQRNPHALFLIVTNPVDIMTRVALHLSGLPARQVFGSGTVLDTARFRALISQRCGIQARHVHAYVIGEHGDSEVLVWSRASIGPFHVAEYTDFTKQPIKPEEKEEIDQSVRNAAYYIIERKGATHFAIGLATVSLAAAASVQQDSVYTVSRQCEGVFGLNGVCLSVPTLVNRSGAHTHFEIELAPNEKAALMKSAEMLDTLYHQLGLGS
ncbi:MAG TPA: L-lactate dehydrogenase [Candidatus Hydrogenedentes bacterium]|nr:L-lactate dehydrogenase [Candidatus Hydrogenedentota bacterium]HOL78190.1 L-lactate dehydrogenase [Candidatus Hydrogenedentota bacterium]HPO87205.1 L-lactate dehydrogenase [Candidatus Hydrogenedentota bacterium]